MTTVHTGEIYKVTNHLTGVMNVRRDDGDYCDLQRHWGRGDFWNEFKDHWSAVMGSIENSLGGQFKILEIRWLPDATEACYAREARLQAIDGNEIDRVFWLQVPGNALRFEKVER